MVVVVDDHQHHHVGTLYYAAEAAVANFLIARNYKRASLLTSRKNIKKTLVMIDIDF